MIQKHWSTPIGTYNLKSYIPNFDSVTEEMIEKFPQPHPQVSNMKRDFFAREPCWKVLKTAILTASEDYASKCGLNRLLMSDYCYANIYRHGYSNNPHHHAHAKAIGVYFVAGNGPESGNLLLQDPRGGIDWPVEGNLEITPRGPLSSRSSIKITPTPGILIMAPAFIIHSVEPNLTQKERITVNVDFFDSELVKGFRR